MKKSLRKRICVIGMILVVLFIAINIILTFFFMIPFSVRLSMKQMEQIALTMMDETSYSDERFNDYIEQIDEDMNTAVTVIDGEKNVISTTKLSEYHKKAIGEMSSILFDQTKDQLDEGETVSMSRNSTKQENVILIRVIKKVADDRYVILARSYRSLENAMHSAIVFDLLSGIVIVLIGIVIVSGLSQHLVVPIKEMQQTAEHISNLEFDTKVKIRSQDELGQLGQSINRMSDHLEENVEQLQNDIENRKRLVRNISHEIKSPVAVIMGYADRLKVVLQKNPERALQYCEIISNESSRVDILVKEMLEFSKLEQRTGELYIEKIPVRQFFAKIQKRFEEENYDRRIDFQLTCGEEDIIKADEVLLERAIYNILGNAVAYGSAQDLRIILTGMQKEDYYEFSVYNSGNGIPEEMLDGIWDAFVKVDKARTRGRQGSGVGLSIVREIVETHGGYYRVENTSDGVIFTISVQNEIEL